MTNITINLDHTKWTTLDNIPAGKDKTVRANDANGGQYFTFPIHVPPPTIYTKSIDYLTTKSSKLPLAPLTGATSITAIISTVGDAAAVFSGRTEQPDNDDGLPPNVRLFIQKDITNSGGANERWWAINEYWVLQPNGSFALDTALTPDRWSNVNGQRGDTNSTTLAGFADCLAHIKQIGMTYGARNAYGHGLWATKPVVFTLESYIVNYP